MLKDNIRHSELSQQENNFYTSYYRAVHNSSNPYTRMHNDTVRDRRITFGALGVLAFIFSHAKHWNIFPKSIWKEALEGRQKIYNYFKELIEKGYALRLTHKNRINGKFQGQIIGYVFFEVKATQEDIEKAKEEFKKCFRETSFRDTDNWDEYKEESLPKGISKNKEIEGSAEAAHHPPPLSDAQKNKKAKRRFEKPPVKERMQDNPDAEKFLEAFDAPLVGVSDETHEELVEKHGETFVLKAYQELAVWKLSKARSPGLTASAAKRALTCHEDAGRLVRWVIPKLLEESTRFTGNKTSVMPGQAEEDERLADRIVKKFEKAVQQNRIYRGHNYLEFIGGGHSALCYQVKFGEKGFHEKVRSNLLKMNLIHD